ncbi:MAG: hypothetical protein ABI939_08975 [Anaerolineaceae bacterium]
MKVKTSITLSPDILVAIDREAGENGRSQLIEKVLARHFLLQRRAARDAKDAAIYASLALDDEYHREVEETLALSIDPMQLGDDVDVLIDTPGRVHAQG